MVDTTAKNLPGEYARMFVVLSAVFCIVHAISNPTAESVLITLLSVAVLVRGLGPVGTGTTKLLITTVVFVSLGFAVAAYGLSGIGLGLLAMLILLTMKLATENLPSATQVLP